LIPRGAITEWQARVPWPQPVQVEQDLVLTRLMIEIANHELLGGELIMRGGTCLHKLHLRRPSRYSEDLDYVRRTHSGIKPYVEALREIAAKLGLEVGYVNASGQMVHVLLDAEPTVPPGRIRVKVEINVAETQPFRDPIALPLTVESQWFEDGAEIPTYVLEELMGTKLRALYQREKGRDLFDLWLTVSARADAGEIVAAFHHYMGEDSFTYPQLRQNLGAKLVSDEFNSDLAALVTEVPDGYDVVRAADVVMELLGSRLRNAPGIDDIADGRWRRGTQDGSAFRSG
jgi:predicted nucleotidyltransferase component of viral defense system